MDANDDFALVRYPVGSAFPPGAKLSLFPGMDPFLEDETLWPQFRHQLVNTLAQRLMFGAEHRYACTVDRRTLDGTSEHGEEYVLIREKTSGRLVTLLDVVSPAAKYTETGRAAFLATRQEAIGVGASVVEIDLILGGRPTLEYARDGLPAWDYAVTVSRATHPERYEIYTSSVAKRLPRFKLPLAAEDQDIVVDLQADFGRAYACGFSGRINYHRDLERSWSDDVRARIAEILLG